MKLREDPSLSNMWHQMSQLLSPPFKAHSTKSVQFFCQCRDREEDKPVMIINFSRIALLTLWLSCPSLSNEVLQVPPSILRNPDDSAIITCSHSISSYDTILWYHMQTDDSALKLIGYIMYTNTKFEQNYNKYFNMSGDGSKKSSLDFQLRHAENSSVFYCAATMCSGSYPPYFGEGTRLTVLEPDHDVTPPTVQVFKPSEKECKVKTLVCVASGFYPDHVSVSWEVDGLTETDSVATDNTALKEGKHYSLSSRLTVQSKTWFKPSKKFTCRVSFFNGTDTIPVEDSIIGETDSGGMPNDTKMKIMQNAKLTYSVLIAKSFIYGVFIMFLVWKLKGLSGKQSSRERSCGLNN
ncbi:M1-specific T cell receptor beta chain-like isoform X1 [Genypterus blacodes]|uniref:M1-specific T cell receptor beta chain-like isoform X1 n=1 Tax=Genypterus blacodes TaxID=154954 RepID=UPI003F76F57C